MESIQSLNRFLQSNLKRNSKEDYTIDGILIGKNDTKVTARKKVGFGIFPHYKEYLINNNSGIITRVNSNPSQSRKVAIQGEDLDVFKGLLSKELDDRKNFKCKSTQAEPKEQLFKILEKTMQSFFSVCNEGERFNDKPVKEITYQSCGVSLPTSMGLDQQSLHKRFDQALSAPTTISELILRPCEKKGHVNNDHFFKREVNGNLIIGLLDGVGSASQFSNAKKVSRQFLEKLSDRDYLNLIHKINLIEKNEKKPQEACRELKEIIDNCSEKVGGEFTFAIMFNLPSGIHTFFKGDTQAGIYDNEEHTLELITKSKISSKNIYAERGFTTIADSIIPKSDWELNYKFNELKNTSTLFLATDGISDLFALITGKQQFNHCPQETKDQVSRLFKKLNKYIPNELSYIVHDLNSIESIFEICEGEPARIKKVIEIFCDELEMTKKDDRTGYFIKVDNGVEKDELDIKYHGNKLLSIKHLIQSEPSNHSCNSNASTAQLTNSSSKDSL